MNCVECRDNMVTCAEGLLEGEQLLEYQAHVTSCAACHADEQAVCRLQQRLMTRGQAVAQVSLVVPVMRRVHAKQIAPERIDIMKIFMRLGLGLGAAAVAVAILMFALPSNTQAKALKVMQKGAQSVARLTSIHFRGQFRTAPHDNFSAIMPDQEFVSVELWKQFQPELKWRIDKPLRVAAMNGQTTLMFDKQAAFGWKFNQPSREAFDTGWLHQIADINHTLTEELNVVRNHGWPVTLSQGQGADGKSKSVITIEAKSGLPEGDYLKNKLFATADTRRVYTFDNETERLESVRVYLQQPAGAKLIFEITQIDYDQPLEASVFEPEVPSNIAWYQEPEKLPADAKHTGATPEEAARTFFEACGRKDWDEASRFVMFPLSDRVKEYVEGVQIIQLGQPFGSEIKEIQFVPYEVKLKNGFVKKHNLQLRKDERVGRWLIGGGL